jgi:hypothetical protein
MSRESHERTFQSREIVWNTFESMARELDVPIDSLVNEAMEAYARVRGYTVSEESSPDPTPRRGTPFNRTPIEARNQLEETHDGGALSSLDRSYAPARAPADFDDDDLAKTAARGTFSRPGRAPPPPRGRLPGPPSGATRPAVDPPPSPQRVEPYTARPPVPHSSGSLAPPLPPPPEHRGRQYGPATVPMPGAPSREASAGRRLVLTYQGRPQTVDKERFLIGRSKTQADLRLDDPNVSRQHAVIERVGSAWYIVDLGSTNGVLVAGERVTRRALSDGDVIVITSHEIRCSVR